MENIQLNFAVTSNMTGFISQVNAATAAVQKFNVANKQGAINDGMAVASQNFNKAMSSSGAFHHQMVQIRTEADKLGGALSARKLGLGDSLSAIRGMNKEYSAMTQLAEKNIKAQQSMVTGLRRDSSGKLMADVWTPDQIQNVNGMSKAAQISREKMKILHETVRQGSDAMINLGKNTQWAGRQMMVGLSLPVGIAVGAATKAFIDMDKELVRIQKVYGAGLNQNAADFQKQGEVIRKDAMETAQTLASAWGQSSETTLKLEGDLAAVGKTGKDLQDSVKQMSRLSILGEIDPNAAMKAGLALQTAFKQNNDELTKSIDFMNAVENQTSTSMNDLVEAIPRAGATIHNLGGDVKDLSLYMTALREGGVSAGEGANALKSGLASIMSPADGVQKKLKTLGIDIKGLVQQGGGDLTKTLMLVGKAMDNLSPVEKTQAMVTLFGKFQFNKMAALLNNLGKEGSQTNKVLQLMGMSATDLAKNSEVEMQAVTESASGKWNRMIQSMKVSMAILGKDFAGPITSVVGVITGLIDKFNKLNGTVKAIIEWAAIIAALVGPIVMVAGVMMNFVGTLIKGGAAMAALFSGRGRGRWTEFRAEMSGAKAITEGLITPMQTVAKATDTFAASVQKLTASLSGLSSAQGKVAAGGSAYGQGDRKGKGVVLGNRGGNQLRGAEDYTAADLAAIGGKDRRQLEAVYLASRLSDPDYAAGTMKNRFTNETGAPIQGLKETGPKGDKIVTKGNMINPGAAISMNQLNLAYKNVVQEQYKFDKGITTTQTALNNAKSHFTSLADAIGKTTQAQKILAETSKMTTNQLAQATIAASDRAAKNIGGGGVGNPRNVLSFAASRWFTGTGEGAATVNKNPRLLSNDTKKRESLLNQDLEHLTSENTLRAREAALLKEQVKNEGQQAKVERTITKYDDEIAILKKDEVANEKKIAELEKKRTAAIAKGEVLQQESNVIQSEINANQQKQSRLAAFAGNPKVKAAGRVAGGIGGAALLMSNVGGPVGDIAGGAMMGGMLTSGPWGAIIGGAIVGLQKGNEYLKQSMANAASVYQSSALANQQFGLKLKSFNDNNITDILKKTTKNAKALDSATKSVDAFAKALHDASPNSVEGKRIARLNDVKGGNSIGEKYLQGVFSGFAGNLALLGGKNNFLSRWAGKQSRSIYDNVGQTPGSDSVGNTLKDIYRGSVAKGMSSKDAMIETTGYAKETGTTASLRAISSELTKITNQKEAVDSMIKRMESIISEGGNASETFAKLFNPDVLANVPAQELQKIVDAAHRAGLSDQELMNQMAQDNPEVAAKLQQLQNDLGVDLVGSMKLAQLSANQLDIAIQMIRDRHVNIDVAINLAKIQAGIDAGMQAIIGQAETAVTEASGVGGGGGSADTGGSGGGGGGTDNSAQQAQQDAANALQKQQQEELKNMQKLAQERQKMREEEIKNVTEFYDKQLTAMEKTEEARKKAFEAEQKRQDREKSWHSLQLDMAQAVAKGDTFGILKAGMDMKATQKGWLTEDKNTAAEDAYTRKHDALLAKKDAQIAKLTKENERLSAQDQAAYDAKQEANQAALDALQGHASGGYISGPGTSRSDSIRTRLSNGEYVVNASAVSSYGRSMLDSINEQRFATGGAVGKDAPAAPKSGKTSNAPAGKGGAASKNPLVAGDKAADKSMDALVASRKAALDQILADETATAAAIVALDQQTIATRQAAYTTYTAVITAALAGWQTANQNTATVITNSATQAMSTVTGAVNNAMNSAKAAFAAWGTASSQVAPELAKTITNSFGAINFEQLIKMVDSYASGDVAAGNEAKGALGAGVGAATGGYITGPGSGTSDSIPARLSNGEYVIKQSSVQRYGTGFLSKVNRGELSPSETQNFADGGLVGALGQVESQKATTKLNQVINNAIVKKRKQLESLNISGNPDKAGWDDNLAGADGKSAPTTDGVYKQGSLLYGVGAEEILLRAARAIGTPYSQANRTGGPGNGFDCSSFVSWVYKPWGALNEEQGSTASLINEGVDAGGARIAGDILLHNPNSTGATGSGHAALYIGNGMVQESGNPNSFGSEGGRFEFARRILGNPYAKPGPKPTPPWPRYVSGAVNYSGVPVSSITGIGVGNLSKLSYREFAKLNPGAAVGADGNALAGGKTGVTGESAWTGGPMPGITPEVLRWGNLVAGVLKEFNLDQKYVYGVLRQMQQESSGNPDAINLEDSNARAGTPSKGLMQVIAPTYQSNAKPGYTDLNYQSVPYYNVWAAIHYVLTHEGYGIQKLENWNNGSNMAYADGGYVSGPGSARSDSIPARLSNGEYVVQQSAVSRYGTSFLDKVNNGQLGLGGFRSGISNLVNTDVARLFQSVADVANAKKWIKIAAAEVKDPAQSAAAAGAASGTVSSGNPTMDAFAALMESFVGQSSIWGSSVAGHCLKNVNDLWEHMGGAVNRHPAAVDAGAAVAAANAMKQGPAPRGALLWWNNDIGGGYGHVAVSDGKGNFVNNWSGGVIEVNPMSAAPNGYIGWSDPDAQRFRDGGLVIPALRKGATINYDNTLANLHAGEAVLTAPLTQKLNQGIDDLASGSSVAYNVSVNIDKANATPYEIEQAVYSALNKKEIRSGRSRVVGGRK